ncbi:hypothetical protein [Paenibacillus sp. HJGM_3]|uniref:hypothetical protein n=1 Tax=Paenibacillus sp. HJGM_3 TaxID=3379816 RepID=UPI00385E5631
MEELLMDIVRLEETERELAAKLERMDQIEPEYRRIEDELNVVRNRLSEKNLELESLKKAEEEKAHREQKQIQQLDGLQEYILGLQLFESIQPQPFEGERIHEYEGRKQEFNQILVEVARELLQTQHNEHNEAMAAKDEKIRLMTKQGLETENQLAEAKRTIEEQAAKEEQWAQDEEMLEERIRELELVQNQTQTLLNMANDRIAELTTKLEAAEKAQKPAEYTAPSQPLQERVASLRNKTADELLARFNARQTPENQITPPPLETVTPFRGEDEVAATEPQDNPIPAAEAPALSQFPDETNVGMADQTPGVQAEVSRAEFEEAIKRIEVLEKHLFGEEAA